jgi:hypothetical protein
VVGLVVGMVCFGVVGSVWWSSVPVANVVCVGGGCGCGGWVGIVVFCVGIGCGIVVCGRGVDVVGDRVSGGVWGEFAGRWGGGGAVYMVVDIVADGGLVRGAGGGVVVGVSSVFRDYLLPSISPSVSILAFGPARVCFPQAVQFCSNS